MLLSDFEYILPPELIAQQPVEKRDTSRLMVIDRTKGKVFHRVFSELPHLLDENDLLIVNDTKVIPARLIGQKPTGGKVEILIVRRLGGGRRLCMAQATKRIKTGLEVVFPGGGRCVFESREGEGHYVVNFGTEAALEALQKAHGETPLPPYIERPEGTKGFDPERYQTVYAREPGSCAAPTAGLHFTSELLADIEKITAGMERVTLHVGPGTFLPVRTERVEDHHMHEEYFELGEAAASRLNSHKKAGGRIVAVGTTAVRVLEHASDVSGMVKAGSGMTSIFIRPGYSFKIVDRLITNFHLPGSTLLMLVCALAGRELVLNAYREAVREKYRFYSYGDAMLIL
jgi:S-adenosylmethionine:tRNA ribosyltransferase-isomerase